MSLNKHYPLPVIYIEGCFTIVDNMKSANGPRVMLQHRCVWETLSWLLSYNFSYFPLPEVPLRVCFALFFCLVWPFWLDEFCAIAVQEELKNIYVFLNYLIVFQFTHILCNINYHQYIILFAIVIKSPYVPFFYVMF